MCKYMYDCLFLRVWGVNCGSAVQWNGSWRLMYIKRPHLLFVGKELYCTVFFSIIIYSHVLNKISHF